MIMQGWSLDHTRHDRAIYFCAACFYLHTPEKCRKQTDTTEFQRLQLLLTNWCQINFAEVYTMMLHLKAIRIFVESVLRYGLKSHALYGMRPNFKAYIIQ